MADPGNFRFTATPAFKAVIFSSYSLVTLVACASTGSVGGLETTSLVRYECEGKGFSARIAEDNSSVRLRTHEGSVNLDRGEADEFKGDGWTLKT